MRVATRGGGGTCVVATSVLVGSLMGSLSALTSPQTYLLKSRTSAVASKVLCNCLRIIGV